MVIFSSVQLRVHAKASIWSKVLGSQAAFGTIFRIMDTTTSLKKFSYLRSVFKAASKNCILNFLHRKTAKTV
jgi:hypothetical protein